MNDDNKIIEYEREREWLRNSAWGQWWSSGNTETKTLTTNDVYILLAAYAAECVRVERERIMAELCPYCKQKDSPERRQFQTQKPYWVHTMIGFDDRVEECGASRLRVAIEQER